MGLTSLLLRNQSKIIEDLEGKQMKKWRGFFAVMVAVVFALLCCGKAEVTEAAECAKHVYDYDCDHKCNVCGEYR